MEAVALRLQECGLLDDLAPARDATDAEITRVHSPAYLELVKRETRHPERSRGADVTLGPTYLSTGDVLIDGKSLAVARRAAGGAIVAMEEADTHHRPTFALIRPPGHHAERARGMGFCLFNNAAIAARAFLDEHPEERVLVVDFDYHHGNGTQDVAGDGLSYVSTHAYPAYPGSGGRQETIALRGGEVTNVPLPVTGVSTDYFVSVWYELLTEVAARVKPTLLLVSAGFDYVKGDPVGDLGVDVSAASELASAIKNTAGEHGTRIAYVLEGGYNIDALTESIAQVIARG